MPSAIKAIYSAEFDHASFNRENARIVEASKRAERQAMASTGGGFGGGVTGFMGRARVAASMFTSVARDSAASLASGAPISQVIAQQAPQVLQALTFMGVSLKTLGLGAVGASLALLTLQKASEAVAAKQLERQTAADVAFSAASNRMRLVDLISGNKIRLDSQFGAGTADDMRGRLFSATAAQARHPESHTMRRRLENEEQYVREKLKAVILSEKEKKQMAEIADIAYKNRLDSLTGHEKERALIEDKYRRTVQEIKEREGAAKTEADMAAVQYAYRAAAAARNTALAGISAGTIFKTPVTERERIGLGSSSSINVALLDVNKQSLKVQGEIRDLIRKGQLATDDGSF